MPAPLDKETVAASDSDFLNQARPIWKRLLEGTTISAGCNNVFDPDPPHAATGVNFPGALYDPAGRFVYVRVSKILDRADYERLTVLLPN